MNVKVSTKVYPLRMVAYTHSSVDVTISITNLINEILWLECDIQMPETLSLSRNERVFNGRFRFGIINPKETIEKTIKIYGSVATYPDIYNIKLVVKVFNRYGERIGSADHRFNIRCIKSLDIENLGTA